MYLPVRILTSIYGNLEDLQALCSINNMYEIVFL
jgi:hypothetical protein